jgi:preprotein translocase subunit YajC
MNSIILFFLDGGGGSFLFTLLPFVLIFGIFYFLVILPQKKQKQELETMITTLKAGEEIITQGGIVGKIKEVRETSFVIMSADKSLIEITKTAVIGKKPAK